MKACRLCALPRKSLPVKRSAKVRRGSKPPTSEVPLTSQPLLSLGTTFHAQEGRIRKLSEVPRQEPLVKVPRQDPKDHGKFSLAIPDDPVFREPRNDVELGAQVFMVVLAVTGLASITALGLASLMKVKNMICK